MKKNAIKISTLVVCVLLNTIVHAQSSISDGATGITQATDGLKTYFGPAVKLMYVIGALLGIIGGVKVYSKWNRGDHDTMKVAASWFGACIFLVVVASILTAFFGVSQT